MVRAPRPCLAALALCLAAAPAGAQTTSTQKYAETNPSASKGTTGGASLSARMLYGKDGTTEVELTTGEFDSGVAPLHLLSKVSLRGVDGDGAETFQLNYGPLTDGGYWRQVYDSFGPGQPFSVYGLVRTTRNQLVVVSATVRRRPDLFVHDLHAPAQAPVNTPVQITATITEQNGQLGARTDCVLFVDEVEVDRAAGVWVDSGDDVSCAFAHTFPDPGSHAVRVSALNVRPGDWDTDNNSASSSIEVIVPTQNFQYANAWAETLENYTYHYTESGRTYQSSSSGYDWYYDSHQTRSSWSSLGYYGYSYTNSPVTSVSAAATDGTTSWSMSQDIPAGCYFNATSSMNGRRVYLYVESCSGLATVQLYAYAGTVTYTSYQWQRTFVHGTFGTTYGSPSEWYSNGSDNYGDHQLAGDAIAFDVAATLADGTILSTPLTVTLSAAQPYSYSYSSCPSGSTYNYCYSYNYSYTQRYGSVSHSAP
jgi:hypothetical protein